LADADPPDPAVERIEYEMNTSRWFVSALSSRAAASFSRPFIWYYVLCHGRIHLARDASAIEWCLRAPPTATP